MGKKYSNILYPYDDNFSIYSLLLHFHEPHCYSDIYIINKKYYGVNFNISEV